MSGALFAHPQSQLAIDGVIMKTNFIRVMLTLAAVADARLRHEQLRADLCRRAESDRGE